VTSPRSFIVVDAGFAPGIFEPAIVAPSTLVFAPGIFEYLGSPPPPRYKDCVMVSALGFEFKLYHRTEGIP
jgi:hypothetical protein